MISGLGHNFCPVPICIYSNYVCGPAPYYRLCIDEYIRKFPKMLYRANLLSRSTMCTVHQNKSQDQ